MLRMDHLKRISAFFFSTGAVLFWIFLTQPPVPSMELQQQRSHSKEIVSVQSVPSSQTSQANQVNPSVQLSGKETLYQVKTGDTLSEIALRYSISVSVLKEINGLVNDNISIDQKLVLPDSAKPSVAKQTIIAKTGSDKKRTSPSPAPTPSRSKVAASGRVGELVHWSKAQLIFARGETAALIDVISGESFNIKRKGGHNHADCEPLTAGDASIMKSLYKTWSWDRRAVVLVVDGQKIAASMAGMPHGSDTIADNSFSGHFDLHFLGSMTHGSSYTKSGIPQVDPDHQAMVRVAAGR